MTVLGEVAFHRPCLHYWHPQGLPLHPPATFPPGPRIPWCRRMNHPRPNPDLPIPVPDPSRLTPPKMPRHPSRLSPTLVSLPWARPPPALAWNLSHVRILSRVRLSPSPRGHEFQDSLRKQRAPACWMLRGRLRIADSAGCHHARELDTEGPRDATVWRRCTRRTEACSAPGDD